MTALNFSSRMDINPYLLKKLEMNHWSWNLGTLVLLIFIIDIGIPMLYGKKIIKDGTINHVYDCLN